MKLHEGIEHMSGFDMIRVERDGPLAIITLNRPEVLNAAPAA